MRMLQLPWRLPGALLACISLPYQFVSATASVNVALKASFNAAPYLVELLYVSMPTMLNVFSSDVL